MPAIEILGLSKTYLQGFWRKRRLCALQPLHLAVEEGEVFGYLGPNGAGKTTTLKLLLGLISPSSGTAKLLNLPFDDPKAKTQIGFLPEQPYFYDHLTALELLEYYAQLSGVPPRERRRCAQKMLDRVGLPGSAHTQLRKLSKGMMQRVGLAQAILHDPKLIFLDEPMSGLDPIGRREVRDLIQTLKEEGKTIFFSTHILSDAEALCDRVAVLRGGELCGVGAVAELTSHTQGNVELVWQGAHDALSPLRAECHASGKTVRGVIAEEKLDRAIDLLRHSGALMISVTPVRATLEDYFIEKLAEAVGVAE